MPIYRKRMESCKKLELFKCYPIMRENIPYRFINLTSNDLHVFNDTDFCE